MNEVVGVKRLWDINVSILKQYALFFDRIAVYDVESFLKRLTKKPNESLTFLANEIEWLLEQGFLFEPEFNMEAKLLHNPEFKSLRKLTSKSCKERFDSLEALNKHMTDTVSLVQKDKPISDETYKKLDCAADKAQHYLDNIQYISFIMDEYTARCLSVQLKILDRIDAYPIVSESLQLPESVASTKHDVKQIVINAMPIPNDSVPWDQIFEYRNDPDSASKLLALKVWMNDVARGQLSPTEVKEKLEFLLDQYQQHMKLHKMKTSIGILGTIIIASAEVLENLAKLEFSKLAKSLFAANKRRVDLMEAELTVPGKEVAYITKSREVFS